MSDNNDNAFDVEALITKDKKTIEQGGQIKKRVGRPTKKNKKVRVAVYFNEDDYNRLVDVAENMGLSLSYVIGSNALKSLKGE